LTSGCVSAIIGYTHPRKENHDGKFIPFEKLSTEIEQILGFPIDHAFLTFKKELPAYGYEVGKISMKAQTVAFKRCV